MKLVTTLLLNILFTGIAVLVAWQILPGVEIDGFKDAFVVAAILAITTWIVNWLINLTTIPSSFTFALVSLIATTFLIFAIANWYAGFEVANFRTALLFTAMLTLAQIFSGVKRE